MIIKELTSAGLDKFIKSTEFERMPVLPISRHRAISQNHNPRLDPEDIILLVAYEEDKLIGYLGVLPDYYFVKGEKHKAGWLSCFWVDPDKRGLGISKALGKLAVEKWNGNLIATEFTEPSKRLWLKINALETLVTLEGIRGFLRFNLGEVLPRKWPFLKPLRPLIQMTDAGLNAINELRLKAKNIQLNNRISIESISSPDDECMRFIDTLNNNELFHRGMEEFKWILNFPWILPLEQADENGSKYYFTSFEKRFQFRLVKIRDTQKGIIAVLILSIRNNHLKTPYAYFKAEDVNTLMNCLYTIMAEEKIATFTSCNAIITNYLEKTSTPFIFKKQQHKEYLASSAIIDEIQEIGKFSIQDGDGDCAFT